MKRILLIIAVLASFSAISCTGSGSDSTDKCENITCDSHGSCKILNDEAYCDCEAGYINGDNKLTCIKKENDPCSGISCGSNGSCEIVNSEASCNCNNGYHAVGLNCVKDGEADPCENITCGNNGSCQAIDSQATCNCNDGYHAVGLNCVKDDVTDPCADITCGDNGSCKVVENSPECDCDTGYHEEQLVCVKNDVNFSYKTLTAGTMGSEKGIDIAVDSNDNRWIIGEFANTLDLGCENTLSSANDNNAFIAKISRAGDCLKLIKLESTEIAEPSEIIINNGSVYVLGSFMGQLKFADTTLNSKGESDIFLLKLDTNGNITIHQTFGSVADDYGYGLYAENDKIYISGSFQEALNFGNGISKTPAGGDDMFIARLTNGLATDWVYTTGSSGNEIINDLVVKNGFVYAVGEFSVTLDFDDGAGKDKKNPAGQDGFILKLSDSGVYQWVRTIGGDLDDYLSKIVIDENNNLFVAGSFTDIIDANWSEEDGAEDIFIADGHHDIFITKLDTDGNYINTKQFTGIGDTEGHKGDDFVKDMFIKGSKLYVCGIFSDLLSFDPADEDNTDASRITEGGYDGFIAVLNNELYESVFAFGSDLDDYASSVAIDSTGMLVMTGSWQNTAQFSPDENVADEKESKGSFDLFIWNYKE